MQLYKVSFKVIELLTKTAVLCFIFLTAVDAVYADECAVKPWPKDQPLVFPAYVHKEPLNPGERGWGEALIDLELPMPVNKGELVLVFRPSNEQSYQFEVRSITRRERIAESRFTWIVKLVSTAPRVLKTKPDKGNDPNWPFDAVVIHPTTKKIRYVRYRELRGLPKSKRLSRNTFVAAVDYAGDNNADVAIFRHSLDDHAECEVTCEQFFFRKPNGRWEIGYRIRDH